MRIAVQKSLFLSVLLVAWIVGLSVGCLLPVSSLLCNKCVMSHMIIGISLGPPIICSLTAYVLGRKLTKQCLRIRHFLLAVPALILVTYSFHVFSSFLAFRFLFLSFLHPILPTSLSLLTTLLILRWLVFGFYSLPPEKSAT